MNRSPSSLARRWSLRLRDGVGLVLPLGIAAALVLVIPKEGGSQGEETGILKQEVDLPLCGEWHRGGGETSPVDLPRVRQAYRDLGAQVGRSLDHLPRQLSERLDPGVGTDLPACRGVADRRVSLSAQRAAPLQGRTFYFASSGASGELSLPAELERDPRVEVLLLRVRSVKTVSELSARLGRRVSLADAEFAKALGVRCLNTWVRISEAGDGLDLHEGR